MKKITTKEVLEIANKPSENPQNFLIIKPNDKFSEVSDFDAYMVEPKKICKTYLGDIIQGYGIQKVEVGLIDNQFVIVGAILSFSCVDINPISDEWLLMDLPKGYTPPQFTMKLF
jgi:hypothetical protein